MQDAEKELVKNTSVVQTDITIKHETHVSSNKKVNPSKVQDGNLKENNGVQQNMGNNNIGMTEIITVAGMDINQMITQTIDDADIITTSGDLEDGNTVRDKHNHEHNHRQFKSEDLYNHEDEDQSQDQDQGSNEDNNDKDMEDMYSTNNSPLTPGFPRVVTDPGLNQQFKL